MSVDTKQFESKLSGGLSAKGVPNGKLPSAFSGDTSTYWGATAEISDNNENNQLGTQPEDDLSPSDLDSMRAAEDSITRANAAGIQVGGDVLGQISEARRTGKISNSTNVAAIQSRAQEAEALVLQKQLGDGIGAATSVIGAGAIAQNITVPFSSTYSHIEGPVKKASHGFVGFFDRQPDGTARTYNDFSDDETKKENPYSLVQNIPSQTYGSMLGNMHPPAGLPDLGRAIGGRSYNG